LRGGIQANLLVKEPLERGLEPRYAVTTLGSPRQALAYYCSRMRIDEGFRAGGGGGQRCGADGGFRGRSIR
jgi:hypothetical protein